MRTENTRRTDRPLEMVEKAVRIGDQAVEEDKGLGELERAELGSSAGIEDAVYPEAVFAEARAARTGMEGRAERGGKRRTRAYGLWRFSSPC